MKCNMEFYGTLKKISPCNRIFKHLNLNSGCALEGYNKLFFIQIESYNIFHTSASL